MRTKEDFNNSVKSGDNIHALAKKITNDFITHNDINLATEQHKWFDNYRRNFSDRQYDLLFYYNLFLLEYYEESYKEFNSKINHTFINDSELIRELQRLCRKLNRNAVNANHILKLASWHNNNVTLTKFGNNNLEELLKILDVIININYSSGFFNEFFVFDKEKNKQSTHPIDYYYKYYQLGKKSKQKLNEEKVKIYIKTDGTATKNSVEKAICSHCSNLVREAENTLRISYGAKKVGEGWISETELFYKLKNHFIEFEVVQHGKPDWLGRQHVDIWFHKHSIGIEYQGQQHDRPIEFFGGEKSFEENKKRDERKRMLFKENNAFLIEVREGFDFEILCEEIKSYIKIEL
jgi:hypothetical protein